jgi:hypothetical protein
MAASCSRFVTLENLSRDFRRRSTIGPEWRLAAAMLMQAAEDGAPVMLAEIAMRRALNVDGKPGPPEPRRKRAEKYRIVR